MYKVVDPLLLEWITYDGTEDTYPNLAFDFLLFNKMSYRLIGVFDKMPPFELGYMWAYTQEA